MCLFFSRGQFLGAKVSHIRCFKELDLSAYTCQILASDWNKNKSFYHQMIMAELEILISFGI